MSTEFDVMGVTYRLVETAEKLSDETSDELHILVDMEQHTLWLWSDTPAELRETAIARGISLIWSTAMSNPSSLDPPLVD